MGYFCVHNLPAQLITGFAEFLAALPEPLSEEQTQADSEAGCVRSGHYRETRFALLLDCRGENFFPAVRSSADRLRQAGAEVSLLFFDCQDEVIIRRFRETRRPHPLLLAGHSVATISEALAKERELLADFRAAAARVIDTSSYTVHDLRRVMEGLYGHETKLLVEVLSFGYKYGVPHDADLLIDVRFLPNPFFVPGLGDLTGEDSAVRDYVFATGEADEFLQHYRDLLEFLIPRYRTEGKRYLTIGIGCTGGRHRSVALGLALAQRLKHPTIDVRVRHRDIDRLK